MSFPRELAECVKGKSVLLLDLDNTLYPYEPCHKAGLQASYLKYVSLLESEDSFTEFKAQYQAARASTHQRLAGFASSHSRLLYFQTMLETIFGRSQVEFTLALEAEYWNGYFSVMSLCPWSSSFLSFCKQSGMSIIIVTNLTSEVQMKKLLALNIDQYIDFLVTSEEAGIEKPAPQVFNYALNKIGAAGSDAIIIGDGEKEDMSESIDYFRWKA